MLLERTEVNTTAKDCPGLLKPGVDLLVLNEGGVVAEGLPTVAALKGLFSGVSSHVPNQGKGVIKGLVARGALEGLLSSVDPAVAKEVCRLREGFPTLSTHVGLLSGVDPHVSDKGGAVVKGSGTHTALQGFHSTVGPGVPDEDGVVGEGLPTLATLIRLLPGVKAHVLNQGRGVTKSPSALSAREGLFPSVCPPVPDESGALGEGLPTLAALVRLLSGVGPHVLSEG